MDKSMLENTRMEKEMVKEHTLGLMVESMWGNTRMDMNMVKEHTQTLRDQSL